jgi:hypothetical protein
MGPSLNCASDLHLADVWSAKQGGGLPEKGGVTFGVETPQTIAVPGTPDSSPHARADLPIRVITVRALTTCTDIDRRPARTSV